MSTTLTPKKITDLGLTNSLSDDDVFLVIDASDLTSSISGTSKRTTLSSLRDSLFEPTRVSGWDEAYSWGNHAESNYLTAIGPISNHTDVNTVTTPPSNGNVLRWNSGSGQWVPGSISDLLPGVTSESTADWNTAYSWGNHANEGYLTSLGSINNHTDVSTSGVSLSNNQVLSWDGNNWVPRNAPSFTKTTKTISANTLLADNQSFNEIFENMPGSFALLKIETNNPAWVTLYTDSISRAGDADRLEGDSPAEGSGVIADITTIPGFVTRKITPGAIGWTENSTIYVKAVNKAGPDVNTEITITYIALEN